MAATLLGSLLVSLGLESTQFDRNLGRSKKEITGFQKTVQGLNKTMLGLKTAFAALAGAMVVGAAIDLTKRSLEYASSLGEVALQLGVTTKALQEYRYAATQTGIEQGEMDKSLARLSRTIGEAAGGSKEAAALFTRMGISIRDADGRVRDAGDILPEIGAAYVKLGSSAEKAALAYAVFGKSGQKLAPLLEEGARGINNLRDAAKELGLVLSEKEIADADETADKIAKLKQVLEAKISNAVAANAAAIGDLVDQLIALVNAAGNAVRAWRAWRDAVGGPNAQEENKRIQAENRGGDPYTGGLFNIRRAGDKRPMPKGGKGGGRATGSARIDDRQFTANPLGAVTQNALAPVTKRSGGGGGRSRGSGKTAAELLNEQQERDLRAAEELSDLQMEELRARASLSQNTEDRAMLEQEIMGRERASREAEITANEKQAIEDGTSAKLAGEQAKAQRDLLNILYGQQYTESENGDLIVEKQKSLYGELAARETRLKLFDEENELADTRFRAENDALRLQFDLADTEAERKRIALATLAAEDEYLRTKLQAVIANKDLADAVRRQAELELQALEASASARRESVSRSNETRLESYMREGNRSPERLGEDVTGIGLDGLDSLADGLSNIVTEVNSVNDAFAMMRDVFQSVIQDMIAALIRLGIQKAITAAIGALTGGGGGGLPGTAGGMDLRGFAKGTNSAPRGIALVGEEGPEIVRFGGGEQVIPNHELAGMMGGGGVNIHKPTFNFPGVRTVADAREAGAQAARKYRQVMNGPVRA